jgi:nucleoside-diphosphate-sugar epimerase
MKQTILVAGATGDLGGRIIKSLIALGADVRALVRASADSGKVEKLEHLGAKVVKINSWTPTELIPACEGLTCVVSALQGLHDVIVVGQSVLVDAAIHVGVPRFIPSDFASDLTKVAPGENRNFDLRREFHSYLDKVSIQSTSILNGAFAEILRYNIPFLNFKAKTVGYFGSPDHRVDFTTMDNTAAFTAAAALDASAPRILRIAGIQVSANEMVGLASEILHSKFELVNMGTTEGLSAYNKRERAAHPEGELEVFPNWQRSQYTHSMFTTKLQPLDNDRYPAIKWTDLREFVSHMA